MTLCACGLRRDPGTNDCRARCRAIREERKAARKAKRERKGAALAEHGLLFAREVAEAFERSGVPSPGRLWWRAR